MSQSEQHCERAPRQEHTWDTLDPWAVRQEALPGVRLDSKNRDLATHWEIPPGHRRKEEDGEMLRGREDCPEGWFSL